ncbi:hypothetical protein Tco_0074754 [Tanacetum coccineum]
MLIQHQSEIGEGSGHPTDLYHTHTTDQPHISEPIIAQSSHQPIKTYKPRKPKKKVTQIPQSSEPIDLVADDVVLKEKGAIQDLETTKTAQAKEITRLKKRVKNLEQRGRSYKVGTSRRVKSSAKASLGDQEDASKQGRNIAEIDANVDISLVHEDVGI